MNIKKTIEDIDETHIRMVIEVMDAERVRGRRTYNLVKSPAQNTEEVCRTACPEAFVKAFAS